MELDTEINTTIEYNNNVRAVPLPHKAELTEKEFSSRKKWEKLSLNLSIYILAYIACYFIKKKAIEYDPDFLLFIPLIIISWGLGTFLSNKLKPEPGKRYFERLKKYYTSLLISFGSLAFFMLQTDILLSRFVFVGTFISAFMIEASIEFFKNRSLKQTIKDSKNKFSFAFYIIDFLIFSTVIIFFYDTKIGLSQIAERHTILLVATFVSWLSASAVTHQFRYLGEGYSFLKAVTTHLKSYVLIISLNIIIAYILQVPAYYKSLYFTSLILYSAWSFVVVFFIYINKIPQKTDDIKHSFLQAYELNLPQETNKTVDADTLYRYMNGIHADKNVKTNLEFTYFKQYPEVFEFLLRKLDLSTFDTKKTQIVRTTDLYNIEVLHDNDLELFINFNKLNDIRRLNRYFTEVNKKLTEGGVFVGSFEPIRYRYKRFISDYPFLLAHVFYFFDFIWHRITPKVPGIRKIFFAFTKGKDRTLSLAEGIGRLHYCGFEIIDLKDMDNTCHFVAKKVREPLSDKNPSYSFIFKMRRLGKDGKTIFVYKLRTMHSYSEYVQEFVYRYNSLEVGGKFKDDFRITKWGRILRKMWIDELPMLINLFKGDLKLVGVRPLSSHYLSLYDENFREKRLKYKPGLIPPYYADLPKTIVEIMQSEEKYLAHYDKRPLLTDLIYLRKAIYNIVLNSKRSA